jgi:hypothetical protein
LASVVPEILNGPAAVPDDPTANVMLLSYYLFLFINIYLFCFVLLLW